MSRLGNLPRESLADAVEKLVAKMNERDLVAALEGNLAAMPSDARRALLEATLDAFRARGESSEDAAEASGIALERVECAETSAIAGLLRYAAENIGLLREATFLYVEQNPALVGALPKMLLDGIAERLPSSP